MMEKRVEIDSLRSFVIGVFMISGMSEADSRVAADVLIFADQRGIRSHGVGNLERIYVKRIRLGKIDPAACFQLVSEGQATALLDGNSGVGLVVANQAMDLAIAKACQCGAAVVAVRNSSHFGSAGYYSVKAMKAGMIGLAMSNLGSQVIARPPDGTMGMVGTNPLSIAAPAADLPSFALDMSTTVASTGRIRLAEQRGDRVPIGWLVDDSGNHVTDPARFLKGQAHLQLLGGPGSAGGYKGFGLALAVDVLAGLLAGAAVGPDPNLLQPGGRLHASEEDNVGHLFIAIDISRFRPVDEFRNAMDRMLGALLGCPCGAGCEPVVYPGYPEAEAVKRQATSVAIDTRDFDGLARLAVELGLQFPKALDEDESIALESLSRESKQCA